jgi:hypothetical protein
MLSSAKVLAGSFWNRFPNFQESRDLEQQSKLECRQHEIEKWRNQISEIHSQVTKIIFIRS